MNGITPTQYRKDSLIDDDDVGSLPRDGLEVRGSTDASALRDALASGEAPGVLDCRSTLDADRCKETVPNAQLYVQEGRDEAAISPGDIKQKDLRDCYFMAPLAALASRADGRNLIDSLIAEKKNAKGEVVAYTVTLHTPSSSWLPGTSRSFTEVKITVDLRYALGHAVARSDGPGGPNEVWPLVMERAYAAHVGGYMKLDQPGNAVDAIEVLTGRPAKNVAVGWPTYTAQDLQRDVDAGKLIVGISEEKIDGKNPCNIVAKHSYAVVGTVTRDGSLFVCLRNPWHGGEISEVPWSEFKSTFKSVAVGSVK
jgi:hypothetical protein